MPTACLIGFVNQSGITGRELKAKQEWITWTLTEMEAENGNEKGTETQMPPKTRTRTRRGKESAKEIEETENENETGTVRGIERGTETERGTLTETGTMTAIETMIARGDAVIPLMTSEKGRKICVISAEVRDKAFTGYSNIFVGYGHIMAMCPSAPGSADRSSAPACYKCSGRGHIQAKCPNNLANEVSLSHVVRAS